MDGYDAFSAGVEPGGLRNRNEIKVLIAFLLKTPSGDCRAAN